jgi:calcineurin-like phosphoesterase family protein
MIIKPTPEEIARLYFTSDLHLNHNREFIYKNRGFDNVVDMTEGVIAKINEVVGPDGILFSLGDFCLNTNEDQLRDLLSRLKIGELWLINGNHNSCFKRVFPMMEYGGRTIYPAGVLEGHTWDYDVEYFGDYVEIHAPNSKDIFCCFHYPIASFNYKSHGGMHLCGHSHGNYQLSLPSDKTEKILDVGWCVHHKPLTLAEIKEIMATKAVAPRHH